MGKYLSIRNLQRGTTLAERCRVAGNFWARLRGLLFGPPLAAGEGLLLTPCNSVHTFGMAYPIDLIFIDSDGKVVALLANTLPGRAIRPIREARQTIELPPGTISATGTRTGDRLMLSPL